MPTSITRINLSGSTNGRPIPLAATATPGTNIHTAANIPNTVDEIHLWVSNTTAGPIALTIEWGGTGAGNQSSTAQSIPANSGPVKVVPGLQLSGGLSVAGFGATASALNIEGYVNRIAQ